MKLVYFAAIPLVLAPFAGASPRRAMPQDADEQADAALKKLVEPTTRSTTTETMVADRTLLKAVEETLRGDKTEAVELLGPVAGDPLEELTGEYAAIQLARLHETRSPLAFLIKVDRPRALRYFERQLREDPVRFATLIRAGFGPITTQRDDWDYGSLWQDLTPAESSRVSSLLDASLSAKLVATAGQAETDAFNLPERLGLCMSAWGKDQFTSKARALVTAHATEAAEADLLNRSSFRELVLKNGEFSPADLPTELAYRAADLFRTHPPTMLALMEHTNPRVRRQAAYEISRTTEGGRRVTMDLALPLLRLFVAMDDDEFQSVSSYAQNIVHAGLLRSNAVLSIPEMRDLIRFYGRTGLEDSNQANQVASMMASTAKATSGAGAEDLAQVLRQIFDAPLGRLHNYFEGQLVSSLQTPTVTAAAYKALLGARFLDRDYLAGLRNSGLNNIQSADAQAEFILDIWLSHDPADHSDELWRDSDAVKSLPAHRRGEALTWLGQTDGRYDYAASHCPGHWSDSSELLRTRAFDPERPWKERIIALLGLFASDRISDQDVTDATGLLREVLMSPEQRDLYMDLEGRRRERGPVLRSPWDEVVAGLFEIEDLPVATKERLGFSSGRIRAETAQRLMSAAAPLVSTEDTSARFSALADKVELILTQGSSLVVPRSLLLNWLTYTHLVERLVAHLSSSDPASPERSQDRRLASQVLAAGMAPGNNPSSLQRDGTRLLALGGDENVPLLLDCAERVNSLAFSTWVKSQIDMRLKLRELRERWGADPSDVPIAPTRESAVMATLALLDSPDESIQIEAIRGLTTLGAAEAIPQLIERTISGSEAVKKAAREALEQLSQRARLEAERK